MAYRTFASVATDAPIRTPAPLVSSQPPRRTALILGPFEPFVCSTLTSSKVGFFRATASEVV